MTYLHLWDRFSSQHGLVHDAGTPEKKKVARDRVVVLRPGDGTDVPWDQVAAEDGAPLAVTIHLGAGGGVGKKSGGSAEVQQI